tara:strand:- start:15871 stop:16350 length:480 start_codon:yes stop_codon:yes gene_type:complete
MLNWVDIAIVLVVGVSGLFGLWRGFVREILSLLTWIAAIVVARMYSPLLVPMFSGMTENETGRYVLAFATLCIGTLIIGAIINKLLTRLINMAGLQITDRLLGMVFGLARGVVIVAAVVYFAAGSYSLELWWQESITLPYIEQVIDWAEPYIGNAPAVV